MYLTCDCGEVRHIHKVYLPDKEEIVPVVCSRCDKEWELYGARNEIQIREVVKPTTRPMKRREEP